LLSELMSFGQILKTSLYEDVCGKKKNKTPTLCLPASGPKFYTGTLVASDPTDTAAPSPDQAIFDLIKRTVEQFVLRRTDPLQAPFAGGATGELAYPVEETYYTRYSERAK
jgi:hypothetical protein